MNSLKQIYLTSTALAKDSQKLTEELAKFNPGIGSNDKKSLATLAAKAARLAYLFASLRVDIINKHEENQGYAYR